MARNPIAFAWAVIWLSMLLFAGAAAAGVAAGLHYVATALMPASAVLLSTSGTVLVQEPTWVRPGVVHENQPLASGDRVVTDTTARAQIRFADGSTVTVQPGTELLLTSLRQNRYHWLSGPRRLIDLTLDQGRLEAAVPSFPANGSAFRIHALGTTVSIPEGTTDIWLSQPRTALETASPTAAPFTNSCCATQVLTQNGTAIVQGSGASAVTLQGDQRATVPMGGVPYASAHADWDLLVNGSFQSQSNGLPDGWDLSIDPPNQQSAQHVALTNTSDGPDLHLWSTGAGSNHRGIYFQQELNRDVRDFLHLNLLVNFRINAQSLPGGGIQGSEFPFRVSVRYISRAGQETTWFHGFYNTPAEGAYYVDGNAQQVPLGQWFPHPSGDYVLSLSDLPDPPVFIEWVQFSASGWDFDADVHEVRLLAQ